MSGVGPDLSRFRRRRQHRDLITDHRVRDLTPDRRRSSTMHASVYEELIKQRLRESHSQAREARLARALSASRRAARADRVAAAAAERAVAVLHRG